MNELLYGSTTTRALNKEKKLNDLFRDNTVNLSDGNWLYSNTIEQYLWTTTTVFDEDWKTALAHNIPSIPKHTRVKVAGICRNFYGKYVEVRYNGHLYYIDPQKLSYRQPQESS